MTFLEKSSIFQKFLRFNAFNFKDGKFLVVNNPCSILPLYVQLYLKKIIEKECNNVDKINRSFYHAAKLQSNIGVKIMNQRFGYAKKMNKKQQLEFNLGQTEFLGIGKFRFVKMDFKNSEFIIRGFSPFAQEHRRFFGIDKNPVDYFLMGLFSGGISTVIGREIFTLETKCIAQGDQYCEFIVGLPGNFDSKNPIVRNLAYKKVPTMEELGKIKPYVMSPL